MADTQRYPTFSGIARFNTFADFPTDASDGTFAVDLLTNNLYEWDETTLTWLLVSNPTAGVITGGGAPNQITYWATASNLAGDDDLTWDNATKTFTSNSTLFQVGDYTESSNGSFLIINDAQPTAWLKGGLEAQLILDCDPSRLWSVLGDPSNIYLKIDNANTQFHLYDSSTNWFEYTRSAQTIQMGDIDSNTSGLRFSVDAANGFCYIGNTGTFSEGNHFLLGSTTFNTLSLGVPGKDNYLRIGGTDAEDLTFFSSGDSADHFQILGSIKYYAIGFDGLPNNSVLQIDSTNNTINLICDSTGANQQIMQMSSFDNYTSIGGTSNIFLDSGFEGIFLATNNVTRIGVQNTFTSLEAYGTSPGETYELRFKALPSVGGYYIGYKAPDSRTSSTNLILKLPPNDPTAGQVMAFTAPVSGVSTGSWSTPLSSGTAWLLDGNTNGSEKYIGTDDNFRFPIRVNNVETISFETNSSINRDGVLYSVAGTSGTNTNTTWGRLAGNAISSGTHNLLFGSNAGLLISSSSYNVIVGVNAGVSMTTSGGSNVFIGEESGHDQTTGYENVFIGQGSGRANLSGQRSVAIGTSAANLGTACDRFVAIGFGALAAPGSAADCVGVGYAAGTVNTGNANVYVGGSAGYTMTSGNSNVMLGYSATLSTITQSNAFVVGSSYAPIYDVYVGQGDFNASASAVTYHGTGGVGTDKVGGDLVMAAGQGTGAGTIGTFIIKTPTLGSTGTTIQSLATRATFAQTNVSFSPHGTSSGNTYELRFLELAANGTNYTAFKSADSLAQTTTYVLPSTDPTVGQYLLSSAPAAGICTLSWGTPGGGGSTTFADNVFRIQDDGDATKQLAFELSGITAATTRTVTQPDYSGSMVLSNGTLNTGRILYYTTTGLQDTTGLSWSNANQQLVCPVGTSSLPGLSWANTTGFYQISSGKIGWSNLGTFKYEFNGTNLQGTVNGSFALRSSAGSSGSPSYTFINDNDTGMYSDSADTIKFAFGGQLKQTIDASGRSFFGGLTAPAAFVHIAAGSTTIAPIQLVSGTSLTSPVAGSMEFTTDDLFFTITTGTARKNIALWDTLGTSGRVAFSTTNGRLTDDADLTFATDTLTCKIYAVTTRIEPVANDGAPLGSTTKQFSDLFLAEGGVINWDNGDATLTQVGDVVTLAGADLKVTTPGNVSTSVLTTDGTQNVTNKTIAVTQLNGSANTVAVNNTGATANYTETTYKDVAKAAYTDTIAWTGTTAPSGATNHEFWWKQFGNLVTVTISLSYATAGSALSLVDMILPAAIPVPVAISGTTTNDKVASGIGWIDSASNGTPPACRVWMIKNASTYSIRIAVASNNSKVAFATITYSTN